MDRRLGRCEKDGHVTVYLKRTRYDLHDPLTSWSFEPLQICSIIYPYTAGDISWVLSDTAHLHCAVTTFLLSQTTDPAHFHLFNYISFFYSRPVLMHATYQLCVALDWSHSHDQSSEHRHIANDEQNPCKVTQSNFCVG